jgi:hypothetical protein
MMMLVWTRIMTLTSDADSDDHVDCVDAGVECGLGAGEWGGVAEDGARIAQEVFAAASDVLPALQPLRNCWKVHVLFYFVRILRIWQFRHEIVEISSLEKGLESCFTH